MSGPRHDGFVGSEPQPWAFMTRGELIERLSTVATLHGYTDLDRCQECGHRWPCSSRITANGVVIDR